MSLRKAINDKCAGCVYDPLAAGTKRQQTTLCSSFACPLWPVRPVTKAPIPESVLKYYGIRDGDPCLKIASVARDGAKLAVSQSDLGSAA